MPVPLAVEPALVLGGGRRQVRQHRRPRRAAVRRLLEEREVEVLLDVEPDVGRERGARRHRVRLRHRRVDLVAHRAPVEEGARLGRGDDRVEALVRQERERCLQAELRRGVVRAELQLLALAEVDRVVELPACARVAAEPAELELLPGAQVGRGIPDAVAATVADVGAGAHERPEAGRVLGTAGVAGGVVEVRQAEVVRVLVREHAEAAVLRLDRVVADPDVDRMVRDAAGQTARRATRADVHARKATGAATLNRGVPAMAPDRVGALVRVARSLVATGVDDLEVVDEVVRLVEVPVAVEVVAIPDVELLQVRSDLRVRLALGDLALDPVRHRVADQEPGVVADDAAAEVTAVARLVERHLDPTVDRVARRHHRVAVRRLLLEVLRHAVEVHVLVVGRVVVRLPQASSCRSSGSADRSRCAAARRTSVASRRSGTRTAAAAPGWATASQNDECRALPNSAMTTKTGSVFSRTSSTYLFLPRRATLPLASPRSFISSAASRRASNSFVSGPARSCAVPSPASCRASFLCRRVPGTRRGREGHGEERRQASSRCERKFRYPHSLPFRECYP